MDKAKRKAIIAGNWKMNKTATEAAKLVDELIPAVKDASCEVVICTPYTDLVTAVEKTKGTNIHVGAENVHFEKSVSAKYWRRSEWPTMTYSTPRSSSMSALISPVNAPDFSK